MLKFLDRNSSASVTVVSLTKWMRTFGWDGLDGWNNFGRCWVVMCRFLIVGKGFLRCVMMMTKPASGAEEGELNDW